MAAEVIPPEIAKTLVGWRKHINTHTLQGRFNVRNFILFSSNSNYLRNYLKTSVGHVVFGKLYRSHPLLWSVQKQQTEGSEGLNS